MLGRSTPASMPVMLPIILSPVVGEPPEGPPPRPGEREPRPIPEREWGVPLLARFSLVQEPSEGDPLPVLLESASGRITPARPCAEDPKACR